MDSKIELSKEGEYVIRTGQALPLREPKKVAVVGNIDAPKLFLLSRKMLIASTLSHIIVNRFDGEITLVVNEVDPTAIITGKFHENPDLENFQINEKYEYNSVEFAHFVKMNRHHFETNADALKLVATFQNFKAKLQKEIELKDDGRGNKKVNYSQIISEMSIPETFRLSIPIFKNSLKVNFEVEIIINPDTLALSLISPQLNEAKEHHKSVILNSEIEEIKAFGIDEMPILYI